MHILIVDDHPLMRYALRLTIEEAGEMLVVGEARLGAEALQMHRRLRPDVTIMDLLLPDMDGPACIHTIVSETPLARVLAFSSQSDEELIHAALQAGAVGYLPKESDRAQLLEALRAVYAGRHYLTPEVTDRLAKYLSRAPAKDPQLAGLSKRENEILKLMGEGASTGLIAQRLCLSESTVRTHISHLRAKLNLEHRFQMIIYAAQLK